MKSPCIVLQDVDYSGESLRFAAEEEHLYWREVWLARIDRPANGPLTSFRPNDIPPAANSQP
jgi:hypothetical protein